MNQELAGVNTVALETVGGSKQLAQILQFRLAADMRGFVKPTIIERERAMKWSRFMMEELCDEYRAAVEEGDIKEILDALVDGMVFLLHAVCDHGLQHAFEAGFDEVMRSNFTKFENGKPVWTETGKLDKGPSYTPPDLLPPLCRAAGLTPIGVDATTLNHWLKALAGLTLVGHRKYIATTEEALRVLGVPTNADRGIPCVVTMGDDTSALRVVSQSCAVFHNGMADTWQPCHIDDADRALLSEFLARK